MVSRPRPRFSSYTDGWACLNPVVLLVLLSWCAGLPAQAQNLPVTRTAAEQQQDSGSNGKEDVSESPQAIPAEQIPERMEQARELARRALEIAQPRAEIRGVQEQVDDLREQMEALEEEAAGDARERVDMRGLESAATRIAAQRREIDRLRETLGQRTRELADWRNRVQEALQSWQKTEEQVSQQDRPGGLLDTVRSVLQRLDAADRELASRQDEMLEVQGTLTGWSSQLRERESGIQNKLSVARAALFEAEHPPLWRAEAFRMDLDTAGKLAREDWKALRDYLGSRPVNAWGFFAALALLLAAFVAVARKVSAWTEQKPDLAETLGVFRRPLAAALVLALLAAPWIYPDAPVTARELLGLLLILPLLRVMKPLVAPSLRGALYLVAGFYLLTRAHSLLLTGTSMGRYYMLALLVAAVVVAAGTLRSGWSDPSERAGRWWQLAQAALRLGLVLLVIAVLANIVGLVSLAGLIGNGVISSAFAAVVLYAGVLVARAALLALLQTPWLQRFNLVRWHGEAIDRSVMRILPLAALAGWVLATIRLFRVEQPFTDLLYGILFSNATIGSIEISLGDIVGFVLAIWLGLLASRALRFVLEVDVFPRVSLPRGIPATISMLINYTVLGIAVILAVAAAGIQMDRFAIIVGALSVGIGFGLQNIVNNFVSGLILAFERPVQAGDTIEFTNTFGNVTRIGVRSSTVRTFDGAEVIVPNANLISNEVTNWTLSDRNRRIEILAGVAYGTDPHRVLKLLEGAAQKTEGISTDPPPVALFLGFGDSSLDFSLRGWTEDFDNYLGIKSAITLAVHDALYEDGIEIPFPQRDLHLRSVDSQAVARIGAVQSPEVGDGPSAPETETTNGEPS